MSEPFDAAAAVMARVDPQAVERRRAAQAAYSEAAADLQEAQHQLKAAEVSSSEDDEARCIVRVRRAERRHAEAQQAAQHAEEGYYAALVDAWRAVRDAEYQAHEAFLKDAEARVMAAQQAAVELDQALAKERDQRLTARINPLQAMAQQLKLPVTEWMPDHRGRYA